MRALVVCLAAVTAAACASHRYYDVTPGTTERGAVRTGSLGAYMAQFQALSASTAPQARTPLPTLETSDPALAAALLAATLEPGPESLRQAADEYRRVRVFDQAQQYLERARALAPRDSRIYDSLARMSRDAGLPHVALTDAHRAVFFAPASASARNTLGTVLQAMGRRVDARRAYERAAQLDPLAVYAHNNLCYSWILEGESARALESCRRALALDGRSVTSLNNAGLAYALAGDLAASRRSFAAAGSTAAASFNNGIVYLATRQWDLATRAFEDALAADSRLSDAGVRARQAEAMRRSATP